jgi:hypothetical protein
MNSVSRLLTIVGFGIATATACGSGGTPTEPTPTLGLRDPNVMEARAKFTACMQRHGMKVSDLDLATGTYTVNVEEKDRDRFLAAQRSCSG